MTYHDLSAEQRQKITTLGELKAAGYEPESIKDELRRNLMTALRKGENVFEGIWGYEDTVIPDVERALLARHNINLLGLRGQAKTRLARMMTRLLDEVVPVVAGSELNDDPLAPLSRFAHDQISEHGDHTPVSWWHRHDRFTEKLATPDVTVADLIGDIDPIKAASMKLSYSDERVIHYGLIPRSHRGIFVINELPDLQARIQVALFNILQEGDIQIRGFRLRLPLDIQFVFTANPEDYTNRGSIVTPLKDRIDSQIITHYPKDIEIGKKITQQEARQTKEQAELHVAEVAKDLIEQIAIEARHNEYVDEKSGVSARLTISAYEALLAAAERRGLLNGETKGQIRVGDFIGVIPAITGKVELVYEGEQEGAGIVAHALLGKALRSQFVNYFPDPEAARKSKDKPNPYAAITGWFEGGNRLELVNDAPQADYEKLLMGVGGLAKLVKDHLGKLPQPQQLLMMEFALHGLSEYSMLSKKGLAASIEFSDLLSSMFSMPDDLDEEDED